MFKEEVYQQYLQWKKGNNVCSMEEMFGFPEIDCDVYEDEEVLVSRLFYAVPDIFEVKLRVFIFYEENTFLKDKNKNDDLKLIRSELKVQ